MTEPLIVQLKNRVDNTVAKFGLEQGPDAIWRRHDAYEGICGCVGLSELSGRRATVEIGFISFCISDWFEVPIIGLPRPRNASGPGVYFRLDSECGLNPAWGWPLLSVLQVHQVGDMIDAALDARLQPWLSRFMTHKGWASYFRERLVEQSRGRGILLSMLGYSLLAMKATTCKQVAEVIAEHLKEDPRRKFQNRIDVHLEQQMEIGEERWGEQWHTELRQAIDRRDVQWDS